MKKELLKKKIKESAFKTIIYNNKVIICNYQEIKEINNDDIIIDKVKIIGSDLKIKELNDYEVIINGSIKGVELLSDDSKE